MYRTRRIPFIQSRAAWQLNVATLAVSTIGIVIPFTIIGTELGMRPLPGIYFAFLVMIIISYCLLSQLTKFIYIKIYHR